MIFASRAGKHPNGQSIEMYTLALPNGASVEILTFGGIVRSLRVPDKTGKLKDVVLSLSRIEDYFGRHPYLGAIVGRIAGRVPYGVVVVDGQSWSLRQNEGQHHLHGGYFGLDRHIWQATAIDGAEGGSELKLSYSSSHRDEGYPGNVAITVIYKLQPPCIFSIETEVTTDQATPICLAHHSYFNLSGSKSENVLEHRISIQADGIAEVDADLIPTGDRVNCANHPSDLRASAFLKDAIPRFARRNGEMYFLHPVSRPRPARPTPVARLYLESTGIQMDVSTDEACLQLYTGSALNGDWLDRRGHPLRAFAGVCFECQGYPHATIRPEWGDIIVRPDQPQQRRTQYAFSVVN
jgi:aldose 1-epimerase